MHSRKTIPLLAALTTAPVMCTTALADTGPFGSPDSGMYVGAGWGRFDLHLKDLEDVGTTVSTIAHSRDNAWKAFVGYRFLPFIGVEAAYIDFGEANESFTATGSNGNYRAKLKGWSPSVIGTIPLGPVELFGKLGYYIYNVDLQAHLSGSGSPQIASSHSRSDFIYGGGLGVTFLGHLNVRAEYEVIKLSHADNPNAFWLSAAWRF